MKTKHLILPTLLLTLGLTLTGCDKVITHTNVALVDIVSEDTDHSLKGNCKVMTTKKSKTVTIPDGEAFEVRFDLTIDEGSLSFILTDMDGEEVYNETLEETKDFSVPLENSGKYQLAIQSEKLSGTYDISWGDLPTSSDKGGAS